MTLCKLQFVNNENSQLTPQCIEELFHGIDWKPVDPVEGAINNSEKRLAEAIIAEEDAVAFGGMLYYGHVLVSQERTIGPESTVVGTVTNIVPMDDVKFKPMPGRSGYYGTGIHKMGICPTM